MQIDKVQFINNRIYTNKFPKSQIAFKSNEAQERMQRALRQASIEQMRQKYQNLDELLNYEIHDTGCHNMAQFTLNFACSIENDSEHSLDEFFKSELEAAELRKKLSPACQKNSIEMRAEIQKQPVFKDPALALISAKEMKEFIPEEEMLDSEYIKSTINATKKVYIDAIKNADKTKFSEYEKTLIGTLTSMIETSTGLDFGKEYDQILKSLLDSIKSRKQDIELAIHKQKLINQIKIIK